jgi:hypothetical protein
MEGNISNSVKAQPNAGRSVLRKARFAAGALVVYKAMKQDGLVAELCQML